MMSEYSQIDRWQLINDTVKITVKEEDEMIHHVLYTGFSAFTPDPQNLGIMGLTSEGKTYVVMECVKLFPEENLIILGGASPTSFLYQKGVLVDKYNQPIEDMLTELYSNLRTTFDKKEKEDIKVRIRKLLADSKMFIDFTHKIVIFLESPSMELWQRMKTLLSHDKMDIDFQVTDKGSKGLKTRKIVLHNWPATIFCQPKGSLVVMNPSLKCIEDVKVGDLALGSGYFSKVTKTYERPYSGELVCIQPNIFPIAKFTPDHPIKVLRHGEGGLQSFWLKASDVKDTDFLYMHKPRFGKWGGYRNIRLPVLFDRRYKTKKFAEFLVKKGRSICGVAKSLNIPRSTLTAWMQGTIPKAYDGKVELKWSPSLAKFFGYFVGDGSCQGRYVIVSLNKNQEDIIVDYEKCVKDGLDIPTKRYTYGQVTRVILKSDILAKFLKETFGAHAKEKTIPLEYLGLKPELLRGFLHGLLKSDGSRYKNNYCITTTSLQLTTWVSLALLNVNLTPCITNREGKSTFQRIGYICSSKSYQIRWSSRNGPFNSSNLKKKARFRNGLLIPIRKIYRENYNGSVHNFEVEGSNTYTPPFFTVHNCSANTKQDQWSLWPEIQSRYVIVSPKADPKKYKAGIELDWKMRGCPQDTTDLEVTEQQYDEAKKAVLKIKTDIVNIVNLYTTERHKAPKSIIWIPFHKQVAEKYPSETGTRMREARQFRGYITVNCLINSYRRPFLEYNRVKYPIAVKEDYDEANNIFRMQIGIPPYKLEFYQKYLLPCFKKHGDSSLTSKTIAEHYNKETNRNMSSNYVNNIYLEDLAQYGYLEVSKDSEDRRRNLYEPIDKKTQESKQFDLFRLFGLPELKEAYNELHKSKLITYLIKDSNSLPLSLEDLYSKYFSDISNLDFSSPNQALKSKNTPNNLNNANHLDYLDFQGSNISSDKSIENVSPASSTLDRNVPLFNLLLEASKDISDGCDKQFAIYTLVAKVGCSIEEAEKMLENLLKAGVLILEGDKVRQR